MKRREFLTVTAMGLGAAWLGSRALPAMAEAPPAKFSATDLVTLGKSGVRTTRLAMGTGTSGFGGRSNQGSLGVPGLADLLWAGYDQGLLFIDTADSYGTHPHVAAALKRIPREKVTVLTKTWSRDGKGVRADLDRFRRELGTDYLDIVLLHCLTDSDWTAKYRSAMDVLSEAREKGIVRAHGVSCHSIGALRAAAREPWVQVDLVRLNPIGSHMDADPKTVVEVIRQMRSQGTGIIGMKILGQGDMRRRVDEALKFALAVGVLDAFTIGAENRSEQADLLKRIPAVAAA